MLTSPFKVWHSKSSATRSTRRPHDRMPLLRRIIPSSTVPVRGEAISLPAQFNKIKTLAKTRRRFAYARKSELPLSAEPSALSEEDSLISAGTSAGFLDALFCQARKSKREFPSAVCFTGLAKTLEPSSKELTSTANSFRRALYPRELKNFRQ